MRDPFPIQGRLRGRLESELAAREERRQTARRVVDTSPVEATTRRVSNVAGNERVLRAIPVSVEGVAGVIPGTAAGSDEHLAAMDRHGSIRRRV